MDAQGRKQKRDRTGRKQEREGRKDKRNRTGRNQDRTGRKQECDHRHNWLRRTLNIQRTWVRCLLFGTKTVEVRKYPLDGRQGEEFFIEETGGKKAPCGFKNSIVAIIRFKSDFKYISYQHFRDDEPRHRIPEGSEFDWDPSVDPNLYGWEVDYVKRYVNCLRPAEKKGNISAKALARRGTFVRNESQSHAADAAATSIQVPPGTLADACEEVPRVPGLVDGP